MKIALKSPWVYIARSSCFKCFSSLGKPEKKEKRKIKKGRVRKEWDKKSRGLYLVNGNYPRLRKQHVLAVQAPQGDRSRAGDHRYPVQSYIGLI